MKNDIRKFLDKLPPITAVQGWLPLLFALLLLAVYGFVTLEVQNLNNQEPAQTDVAAKSQTQQVPHIDPNVVAQLKNLKDNSVSVQSFFDSSRSNPFQE